MFGKDTVEFAGFEISLTSVKPCSKVLQSIKDFPTLRNVTDIRSWFGLVNQVAYAFAVADHTPRPPEARSAIRLDRTFGLPMQEAQNGDHQPDQARSRDRRPDTSNLHSNRLVSGRTQVLAIPDTL